MIFDLIVSDDVSEPKIHQDKEHSSVHDPAHGDGMVGPGSIRLVGQVALGATAEFNYF